MATSSDPLVRPGLVAALLAFVSGYVDTVGFVALFGLFTAHVTGNFVLIGASLTRSSAGVIAKLSALPVFLVAVSITTWFVKARQGRPVVTALLLAQMVLLTAFAGAGWAASPVASADAPLAVLAGLLGVAAMGVHNAMSRLALPDLPPTTVMTGNVTQFAIDVTHLLLAPPAADAASTMARLRKLVVPVGAFAAGAVLGALSYVGIGFAGLFVPVAALAACTMLLRPSP